MSKGCGCQIKRRDLLKAGLGAFGWGMLGLPFVNCKGGGSNSGSREVKETAVRNNPFYDSVVWVFAFGGPSQTDTFDPKPTSTSNLFAFNTINLGVTDKYGNPMLVGEMLPKISSLVTSAAAGLGIVRSVYHTNGDHDGAQLCSQAFWETVGPAMLYPSVASVLSYYMQGQSTIGIPAVAIEGAMNDGKGNPITTALNASVGGMTPLLTAPTTSARYARRLALANSLNVDMVARYPDAFVTAANGALQDAYNTTTKGLAASAFDLTGKTLVPAADGGFAQRVTLAQELVKAGVPFISLGIDGNDTHTDEKVTVLDRWGANIDTAVAQMATNLQATGKKVLIIMGGEFGRRPDPGSSTVGGRDHWPDAFSWAFVSINQPKFKTGVYGNTGPDGVWNWGDNKLLVDPCGVESFGGFLYKALGYDPANAANTVPLTFGAAAPIKLPNVGDLLMQNFGLV
jgi:hypothetical protein